MNREQAEHILDAYLSTCYAVDADGIYPETDSKKARDSLREVILDAMTEYRSKPTATWPGITLPGTYVNDHTPKVTWTGVDPTQNISTVSTVDGTAIYQDGVVKVVDE